MNLFGVEWNWLLRQLVTGDFKSAEQKKNYVVLTALNRDHKRAI